METLLSCSCPVPLGSQSLLFPGVLCHCGHKKSSLQLWQRNWDVFSCCQLLPPSFWKAVPYLALPWGLNTVKTLAGFTAGTWCSNKCEELQVVQLQGWQGYLFLPSRGAAAAGRAPER